MTSGLPARRSLKKIQYFVQYSTLITVDTPQSLEKSPDFYCLKAQCVGFGGGGAQMETNKGGFHFSKSDKQLL